MGDYKDRCANCMWGDTCSFDGPCSDYAPLLHSDARYGAYIENQRARFRGEWWEYVEDRQGNCDERI